MYILTLVVSNPTKYGVIIPDSAPIPFTIAIKVPAKLQLKSKALTFIPGKKAPIRPIAKVNKATTTVELYPAYEAPTIQAAGPRAAVTNQTYVNILYLSIKNYKQKHSYIPIVVNNFLAFVIPSHFFSIAISQSQPKAKDVIHITI